MATNYLALLAAWHGIDAPALRKVLRELATWMKDGGTEERKLGVEGLGVFYSQTQPARYIVRGDRIFERPECRVVKLRPAKQDVTEITDARVLDIELNVTGMGDFAFTLEYNANSWVSLYQPQTPPTNEYYLVRSDDEPRRYALILDGVSPTAVFSATQDMGVNESGPYIEFLRWDSMLQSTPNCVQVSDWHVVTQVFVVSPEYGSPGDPIELYESGILNRLALAWFRSRTIAIADVP